MTDIILLPEESNLPSNQGVLTPQDIVDKFIAAQDSKIQTRKTYRFWLSYYLEWTQKTGVVIQQAQTPDIVRYKDYLQSSGKSQYTGKCLFGVVCKFYKWLYNQGVYPRNIVADLKPIKTSKGYKKKGLTAEQVGELLDWSKKNQTLRDYAIITLFCYTGLREMSVEAANIEDIKDFAGKRTLYYLSKGHTAKDKHVILIDDAWKPLSEYLTKRGAYNPGDPMFLSESKINGGNRLNKRTLITICREALDAIGLYKKDKYSPHSLRHSCGQNLVRAGATLEEVQWILGHEDPKTTKIYIDYIEDERRAVNAAENLLGGFFKKKE